MPRVLQLKADFYESSARHTAGSLVEIGELASADFRSRHPVIGDDAVETLAWCYTFDSR